MSSFARWLPPSLPERVEGIVQGQLPAAESADIRLPVERHGGTAEDDRTAHLIGDHDAGFLQHLAEVARLMAYSFKVSPGRRLSLSLHLAMTKALHLVVVAVGAVQLHEDKLDALG